MFLDRITGFSGFITLNLVYPVILSDVLSCKSRQKKFSGLLKIANLRDSIL